MKFIIHSKKGTNVRGYCSQYSETVTCAEENYFTIKIPGDEIEIPNLWEK